MVRPRMPFLGAHTIRRFVGGRPRRDLRHVVGRLVGANHERVRMEFRKTYRCEIQVETLIFRNVFLCIKLNMPLICEAGFLVQNVSLLSGVNHDLGCI